MVNFNRKRPKVLYITGWPGTGRGEGNVLTSKYLRDIGLNVVDLEVHYDRENPKNIFEKINRLIKKEKIDTVVGLSTGGLFTACLQGVRKILINPCFDIGRFLLFVPTVPLPISIELFRTKNKILKDNNTFGFFSTPDQVANSREDFIKIFGKSKFSEIKNSQHVPRSFEWNNQIIPQLRKILGIKLNDIENVEYSLPPQKMTYAIIDGIRFPGMKLFPTIFFNLRKKYLETKGIFLGNVELRESNGN